jgi:acyl phosphate:glycerol-3-phosphate acyltransferase
MMRYLLPIAALAGAFLIGSIPTGYLMGRLKGVDIRRHGSGNIGATNAFRVLGKSWGMLCLALDILKGWLPVAVLFPGEFFALGWPLDGWQWAVGLAAIAGHMFSPFLRFRGGKGVATSLGVILAIAPAPTLVVLLIGILLIWLTGYVSVASMTGAVLLPVLILIFYWDYPPWISICVTLGLGIAIIWKHRANIHRLRQGSETRLFNVSRGAHAHSAKGRR